MKGMVATSQFFPSDGEEDGLKTANGGSLRLLDEVPVIVWSSDADGNRTYLNHRWYDFTGQTCESAAGAGWLDTVHPEDRDLSRDAFCIANQKQEPVRVEYRLRNSDGQYRWAIDTASPRFGPQGEFLGFIGTMVDIHDRKDALAKSKSSEERYRQLFNSIDEGFCVIEMIFDKDDQPLDYRFLEVNPTFEEQTGLVEAVGMTARELVPDLDESWFRVYGQVALTGEPIRFENHAPAMNRWFDVFAFRIDPPEQRRVALHFNEISDRKWRELNAAFLADMNERLARASSPGEIMATVGEEVCRHLCVGSVAFVKIDDSAKGASVFYERREAQGLPSLIGAHDLTNFMSDSFLDELRSGRTVAVSNVATEPGMAGAAETFIQLGVRSHIQGSYVSEGRWKFMLSVHHPEPRSWCKHEIELIRELSTLVWLRLERAWAEESLRESERSLRDLSRSLEQRVASRTAELHEKAMQLRQLAAELGSAEQRERKRLAALLHDDLQQLLVAASMHLNHAARQSSDPSTTQAIEQAEKWIGEATNAARNLTRQLRPPVLYEDGLVPALHGLAMDMRERHQLRVKIEARKGICRINDDMKALLFDSIRELLFNAAKYAAVDHATVRLWEESGTLRVTVEDEGKGFDAKSDDDMRRGNGLGLFAIRERLAASGGGIIIESPQGKGTRITLEIPLDDAVKAASIDHPSGLDPGENTPAAKTTEDRIRIVVVDDHVMVRQGLATMLDEDDRIVVTAEAADGLEAIDAVACHRPDVVLIDVNMPRMNGIEAARSIHRTSPETIIIGLSVQDDEGTAKAMRDAGASAFLSKAGDSGRMIAAIMELVACSRTGKE